MKRTNGYQILFYLVNTLFWFNIFVAGLMGMLVIYLQFDDSILQNSSFNLSLGKGLFDIKLNESPDTKLVQIWVLALLISC
ncbi:hypothetical protein GFV16_04015, partial [Bacillus megaterium]|uniref:hypothetical protein n=1 Tax=Priestia megaterium TaxID=1404 RepID=UPI0012939D5E